MTASCKAVTNVLICKTYSDANYITKKQSDFLFGTSISNHLCDMIHSSHRLLLILEIELFFRNLFHFLTEFDVFFSGRNLLRHSQQ